MNEAAVISPTLFDPGLSRAAAQRLLTEAFSSAQIESAALDARLLLCAALGIDHLGLVRDPDLLLGAAAARRLAEFAARRIDHEPVSRILGRREFFGETYTINPAVLDPRPDTECLVEAVLETIKPRKNEALRVLDLGVGSGAILGALLGQLPHATGIGIDRSYAACERARANLAILGLDQRASVLVGDWMTPIKGRFDIIVSNPPYIVSDDIGTLELEVRLYDPHLALDGGSDGLDAYRSIIANAATHLAGDGLLALELGAGQSASVETILRSSGLEPISSKRDLSGHIRAMIARPNPGS